MTVFDNFEICFSSCMVVLFCSQLVYSPSLGRGFVLKLRVGA